MLTVTKGTVWVIASCIRLACVKTGFKCFRISAGVNAAWTFSLWKVDLIWAHSTPYSRLPVDWCLCVFETYKQLIYTLWIVFNTKTIHHLFPKSINTIFICRWQTAYFCTILILSPLKQLFQRGFLLLGLLQCQESYHRVTLHWQQDGAQQRIKLSVVIWWIWQLLQQLFFCDILACNKSFHCLCTHLKDGWKDERSERMKWRRNDIHCLTNLLKIPGPGMLVWT